MNPQLKNIIEKYLTNRLSADEESLLSELSRDPENIRALEEWITQDLEEGRFDQAANEKIKERIFEKLEAKLPGKVRRMNWRKWTVAASILLAIGTGYWLINLKSANQVQEPVAAHDVKSPDKFRAVITLADGRVISLDSLTSIEQAGVTVTKNGEGKIVYSGKSAAISEGSVKYNTLSNPRGSKVIDMTLSDGTHVWLNAESSITYPVSFVSNQRQVEITGEAYFDVAHDKKPFKVIANGVIIEDLGTEFNVNSYEGTKTTLIVGKVKIGSLLLKPGEQALNDKLVGEVGTDEIIAWKNGLFNFNRATLQEVMKELGRWYDIEVVYEGQVSKETFSGIVNRTSNLSLVLKILENAGIKYKIEGKKLTIL